MDDDFFDDGLLAEAEVKPSAGLGEEGLSGMQGSHERGGGVFEVNFTVWSSLVQKQALSSGALLSIEKIGTVPGGAKGHLKHIRA